VAIINIEANGERNVELTEADLDFIEQANSKELSDAELERVRSILAKNPEAWKMLGDLFAQVRFVATSNLLSNRAAYESIHAGVRQMRKDLLAEGCSETERLLIENILTCWVQCSTLGRRLEMLTSAEHHMDVGAYWDRRYSAAQARFIRAVESLARIRKLKLPNVQLNLGEKQINVSSSHVGQQIG
jgi:hypothetical protein